MGKYEYKISFEKAIEQGIDKNEYARESSKNCIMTWIANELAEANRLKRIELAPKYLNTETTPFNPKDLEDQA